MVMISSLVPERRSLSPLEYRVVDDDLAIPFRGYSARTGNPPAPVPDVPPSAPAAKNYQAAVKLDIDAISAHTKRQERIATSNGAAEPPAPGVIRKTTTRSVRRISSDRR